ncbi:MAG TPA: hypothetical protein VK026_08660 [Paenalcaligenes sp.]|nr:hypothetical protein [Paenalcaligenes sp.]
MTTPRTGFKSKLLAAFLALVGGIVGVHHWYLQRSYAWLITATAALLVAFTVWAELWWDSVAFWLLGLFFAAGAVEAVCLCLIKDSRFDAWYNAHSTRRNASGTVTVLLAILATLLGTMISLGWLAHVVFRVYHHMGWLEGLNY